MGDGIKACGASTTNKEASSIFEDQRVAERCNRLLPFRHQQSHHSSKEEKGDWGPRQAAFLF